MKPYPYYKLDSITDLKMLVAKRAEETPEKTAFIYTDDDGSVRTVTYKAFLADINAAGTYLAAAGIKDTNVALLGENSYEWVVAFFAVADGGNTAVPMDSRQPADNIRDLIGYGDCTAIIYSDKFRAFAESLTEIRTFPLSSFAEWISAGNEEIKKGNTEFTDYPVDPEKMAVLVFTSGTTGKPKGVMLSQKNLAEDVNYAVKNFVLEGTAMTLLPLHHMFGLGMGIFGVLNYGYPAYICRSIRSIAKDFQIGKPQTIFAVPMIVESFYKQFMMMAKRAGAPALPPEAVQQFFGGKLKNIICGGAPLDPMYVEAFRKWGITVLNGYGITECSPVVAVNRNEDYCDGSVGRVIPGCEVKIAEDGEILARGGNVMLGYYHNEEATKEAMAGGWFHTGDLGKISEDGYLFITGRIKNLIITHSGENVSPEEIEEKLLQDPAVSEAVVYGEDNVLAAAIYPEPSAHTELPYFQALADRLNAKEPAYRQIKKIVLKTEPFVRNSTGKIVRSLIGKA